MKKLFASNAINLDLGLVLLRIIIGVLMAFYGYGKLIHFEEMAASDFWSKEVSFLGMTGKTPLVLTVFAEFFCSLLLIAGLLTRLALIPLLICMAYIFGVLGKMEIITSGDNGFEINNAFFYFVIYLALFFTGPGRYSIDHVIGQRK